MASCVRCAREVMINTPSCVARLPAKCEEALSHVGWERARLAHIEAQLDGSGNFVDVLAARAGSANKGHCKFGIWNEYGQMLFPE